MELNVYTPRHPKCVIIIIIIIIIIIMIIIIIIILFVATVPSPNLAL